MLKLFLWLRYLRKRRIVLLSIAAVALSCALMIVVDSLFTGYIKALKESAIADMGDVFLWSYRTAIPKYEALLDRIEQLDGVEGAAPFGYGGGLLYLETGDVREVAIQCIDPERDSKFTDWPEALLRQKGADGQLNFEVPDYPDAGGCWLGINVAAEPNEQTDEYDLAEARELTGKMVLLTTQNFAGKRKVVKLRVSDICHTRTYMGDKTLYLPLKDLGEATLRDDQMQLRCGTKIKLKEGIDADLMKGVIRKVWLQFAGEELGWDAEGAAKVWVGTEQENQGDWYTELHKQMGILLLIFGVICSVAILLIFCIFYMIVMTKQKDIAIIKSCGATRNSAAYIFLGFGAVVGIVGCGTGIIMGYIVTKNINIIEEWVRIVFGMKLWRSSSYMLNAIPNHVNWAGVLPIVLIAIGGCCLGALIPAIVAGRVEPVKILRYE